MGTHLDLSVTEWCWVSARKHFCLAQPCCGLTDTWLGKYPYCKNPKPSLGVLSGPKTSSLARSIKLNSRFPKPVGAG